MTQFVSKTVTHPNPRLTQEQALESLYSHDGFPKDARVKSIKRVEGKWEARFEFPKTSEFPPKKDEEPSEEPSEDGPPSPPKDEGDNEESPLEEALEGGDGPEEGDKPKKPSVEEAVESLTHLVTQIAEAVGVHPGAGDLGAEHELGPHAGPPGGPPGPPAGPPAGGPPGAGAAGAPHPKPPLRPGMAPPGATPVGAPSFASTKPHEVVGKVRSFVVSQVTDAPLEECKRQIEATYGEHGYKVKQIVETTDDSGSRKVRAKISA